MPTKKNKTSLWKLGLVRVHYTTNKTIGFNIMYLLEDSLTVLENDFKKIGKASPCSSALFILFFTNVTFMRQNTDSLKFQAEICI